MRKNQHNADVCIVVDKKKKIYKCCVCKLKKKEEIILTTNCKLEFNGDALFKDEEKLLKHLKSHVEKGHRIPEKYLKKIKYLEDKSE